MVTRLGVGLALFALLGCQQDKPADEAPKVEAKAAKPAVSPAPPRAPTPPPVSGWPAADRLFTAQIEGQTWVFFAEQAELTAAVLTGAEVKTQWKVAGAGVVQALTYGDAGDGPKLFVGRGVGRGFLEAPMTLQVLDLKTGAATTLLEEKGERNEIAHLAIEDVNRDGKPDLAFSHFSSKYEVVSRHRVAGVMSPPSAPIRMATSWAFGDVDGDGLADQVIGRVYGDAKGVPGDLKVDRGQGPAVIPTDNGVRALAIAAIGDSPKPQLFFSDGWVANYGQAAKAQLKRLSFVDGQPKVEVVARSDDEFTFFELCPVDVDGDGKQELAARGNLRVSVFFSGAGGRLFGRRLPEMPSVLNAAVLRLNDGRVGVAVPGKPATQVLFAPPTFTSPPAAVAPPAAPTAPVPTAAVAPVAPAAPAAPVPTTAVVPTAPAIPPGSTAPIK